MTWRIGYMRGYIDGQRAASAPLERNNQMLMEQLADLRFEAKAQRERADRAVDLLVERMGLSGISASVVAERAAVAATPAPNPNHAFPRDPFDELPLGHPMGSYKTSEEAALRFDEARA